MIPELAGISDEARAELEQIFHPYTARRGGYLCYPEDDATTLYYVKEGWVRLFQLGGKEEEITLTVVGQGEIFGEAALFTGHKYGVFAEPLVDCELLTAAREDLTRVASRFPDTQRALLVMLIRRLRRAEDRLRDLRFKEVLPRLAKTLLEVMQKGEEGLEIVLTHQDLAHIIGSTRETVSKVLADLALEDVLELGYRRILVLKPQALQEISR
ncbi:MAG: Crp/Fnr family transcriptional regulator [Armatimonadota bacterium]